MRKTRTIAAAIAAIAVSLFAPPPLRAQQEPPAGETFFAPPPGDGGFLDRVKISGWANLNYRNSADHRVRDNFPFPETSIRRFRGKKRGDYRDRQ